MTGPQYDYIIVGAGTAGCVLAARLTEDSSARVLLVEAGGAERTRAMTVPDAWPELLGSDANWGDLTTAQAEAGPGIYPRGRTLGGSGAINAMAHVRGHPAGYDGWAVAGWAFGDLLPYFRRSEQAVGRDAVLRGTSGPVRVAPVPEPDRHPAARAFAAALLQAGCPATDDLSGRRPEGVAWPDLAIADGQRVSPADAYLRPVLDRPNLTVHTGALATRLEERHGRCTALGYLRDGTPDRAEASGEVILCAGAVGTPQLLMLSGLGPAGHLRAVGIEPVADLPMVGSDLQDHPVAMACYAAPGPLPRSRYNHGEVYAALRSPLAGAWPDLQLFPVLLPVVPPGREAPDSGFALLAAVMAPDSRGTVRLASADPRAAPLIDPGFLRDGRDLDRLTAGLRLIREVATFPDATEVWPGAEGDLHVYIRHTVGSYYHPAGSCRIGPDPDGVVDSDLRVHGITGLRIADASVLPVIPNAPLNATVLAVAEKAADLIRMGPG
ncbi:MAG: GMC family oxidoreductase [Streptosporangiaceae bacterium]